MSPTSPSNLVVVLLTLTNSHHGALETQLVRFIDRFLIVYGLLMVFEGGNVSCLTYQCFMCVYDGIQHERNECKFLRILRAMTLKSRVLVVQIFRVYRERL